MGLFKPDLYRNFGLGFLIGSLLVGASLAPNLADEFSTAAQAAPAETFSDSEPAATL